MRKGQNIRLLAHAALLGTAVAAMLVSPAAALQQFPPGVDIKVHAQATKATVGDPIWIDLDFTLPPGCQLNFPALPERLGEFTVLETFPGPSIPSPEAGGRTAASPHAPGSQDSGAVHYQARVVAALYKPGEFEFPALAIALRDKNGKLQEVRTPPVKIRIESVLNEKDMGLKDLKKQAELSEPFRWLLWLTLAAAALPLLWFGRWWMKRRRSPALGLSAAPATDLLEQAEADLRQLLAQELPNKGMFKQFYVRLSEIMKKALEAGYGIQTIEKTTSEIMAALAGPTEDGGEPPETGCLELAETLLLSCDMVKFARFIPTRNENDQAAAMARQILVDCRKRRKPAVSREIPVAGVS